MPFESVTPGVVLVGAVPHYPFYSRGGADGAFQHCARRQGSRAVWRWRNCASASTGWPGAAADGFVTVCQPRVGVAILVNVPSDAPIAPMVSHVAVTVIWPGSGMITSAGRLHQFCNCAS